MPPGVRMLEQPTQIIPPAKPSNFPLFAEIPTGIQLRITAKRERLWRHFRLDMWISVPIDLKGLPCETKPSPHA